MRARRFSISHEGVARILKGRQAREAEPPNGRVAPRKAQSNIARSRTLPIDRKEGLLARFGVDIALPDPLGALSSCERRADFTRPCGARFTDLTSRTAGDQ